MAIRDVSDETVISLSERPEVKYVEADVNIKVEPFINPIFELQNITNLHQVRSQNDPIWNLDRLNQRTPPLDQDATICTPQSSSSYPAYQGAVRFLFSLIFCFVSFAFLSSLLVLFFF